MKTIELETAQRLHAICQEKGVELLKSKLYHGSAETIAPGEYKSSEGLKFTDFCFKLTKLPAYTTDELLEWLPQVDLHKRKNESGDYVANFNTSPNSGRCEQSQEPQEALAELAIYLVANDLLK